MAIKIEIPDLSTSAVIHRFRNFGEAIHRSLRYNCTVSLEEINTATTCFVVRDIHKRLIGVVNQTIKRELKRHYFDASATLVRL